MTPPTIVEYATEVAGEMTIMARAGQKHLLEVENTECNALAVLAMGYEEVAILKAALEKMREQPTYRAWRERNRARLQAEMVGAMAPERN
jgi:hypothetical protein